MNEESGKKIAPLLSSNVMKRSDTKQLEGKQG